MRMVISLIVSIFLVTTANAADFTLTSKAFANDGNIPLLHGCNGRNISPDLTWSNPPPNTKSFALILASPDWSAGYVYLWILYNIPPDVRSLEEGAANDSLPEGTLVGTNWYEETSYRGPCPPDNLPHHYVFTLYALDTILDLPPGAYGEDIIHAIKRHTLKQVKLTGTFSH